ncbi:MAG: GvpL/GvpF family gas vesicle protein [Terriglobales bacterium]
MANVADDEKPSLPPHGVRSAPVETLRRGALVCYFSRYESFPGGSADELKRDALDFHWTVNYVFQKQAVIPFRFPTLLPAQDDLEKFLERNSGVYLADLQRLRDRVQMEVRFSMPEVTPVSGTGTAYLKAKFDATQRVVQLENLMKSAAEAEWKQRGNRYFALIPRAVVTEFRDKIAGLGQATLRVSGPWPPTEFVNCYPEASRTDQDTEA